jgi:NitT/TauT family transport system permease protein
VNAIQKTPPAPRPTQSYVGPVEPIAMARRSRPLADRITAVVAGWIVLAATIGAIWEWAGRTGRVNPIFISYPSAIWDALAEGVQGDLLTVDAQYTLVAVLIGFSTAALAGIAVAFVLSQIAYMRKLLDPFLTALNSLPRVALAPLFVMWFGIGLLSHVVMAASLTFFVVLANTMAGVESVDQDHLLLARLQGATPWQTFRYFIMPSALPSIFNGLELGFIFGMLGTVSGEMIVGEHGFGVRLQRDAGVFNTAGYFATLFVLVIISAALAGLFQVIKRRLIRWQTLHLAHRV